MNGEEISDEQLRQWFRQLPDKNQNGLLGLPPDEMFRRLRRKHEADQRVTARKAD